MTSVLIGVASLTALGAALGGVLTLAVKAFSVEKHPLEEKILNALPKVNCGGCGFSGCGDYAAAVLAGIAPLNGCKVGGEAVAKELAEMVGASAEKAEKKLAVVHCTGCGAEFTKYDYRGAKDCLAAAQLPGGGPLACDFGCLGMGTCEKVCPFDAIHVENGVAVVDESKCVACGKCVDACPRHIIYIEPYKTPVHVSIPCSSKAKGAVVTKVCTNGCIGCGLCAKNCPKEAISLVENLAQIDYDKCIGCGTCVQKCPRHLITQEVQEAGVLVEEGAQEQEVLESLEEIVIPESEIEVYLPEEMTTVVEVTEEPAVFTEEEEDIPAAVPEGEWETEEAKTSAEAFKAFEEAVAAAGEAIKSSETENESID